MTLTFNPLMPKVDHFPLLPRGPFASKLVTHYRVDQFWDVLGYLGVLGCLGVTVKRLRGKVKGPKVTDK